MRAGSYQLWLSAISCQLSALSDQRSAGDYVANSFLMPYRVVSRYISAIAVVKGINFGHARTQFCALPQSSMPPSAIRASRRSAAFIAPVGWELNSRAWAIAAAPMKFERAVT